MSVAIHRTTRRDRANAVPPSGGRGGTGGKARRKDGSTNLSAYFREMQALDVLRPEQEFSSAQTIEQLEIALWQTLLGFAPATPFLVLRIERHLGRGAKVLPVLRQLEKLRTSLRAAGRARQAAVLRGLDIDKLCVEDIVSALDKLHLGMGARGTLDPLSRQRGFAAWLKEVRRDDAAARAARGEFVKANLRLVVSIARRFNFGRMALPDLIQEGNLGLIKAVDRYDYRRGFRFSTYASWWIRHAISRALADKGREIRLPVHMIDAQHKVTKARRDLTGRLGREPTCEELAAASKMSVDKLENMRSWLHEQSISIDKSVGEDDGRKLAEVLVDPDLEVSSPVDRLSHDALQAEIRGLLEELRPIEADILRQRYGLVSSQELTLKEIGLKYNLSRERIRQLQEQALEKMRVALHQRDMM
jgi:RNA polymerase primary sigma factor